MAKISLVIPCWHSAKHLPHILEDLQAQTFKDFEAILVNDGDDSQQVAMEEITAKDDRIRIIRLEQNGGTAAARNAGINSCTSQWVGFADHDDRFGPRFLQSLYEPVEKLGVELVCGGFTFHYVKTGKESFNFYGKPESSPQTMDIAKAYDIMLGSFSDGMVWNKLYNVDSIRKHSISFRDVKIIDDSFFNVAYFLFVKKVGMIYDSQYIYNVFDGSSAVHRYDPCFLKNNYELISLNKDLQRKLAWSEERICQKRDKDLLYASFRMCTLLFSKSSPLTFGGVVAKIREDILSQPEVVSAILAGTAHRDRIVRLYQWLVRIGNARLMALVFKLLTVIKSRFSKLYTKLKPFFRGD